MDNILVLGQASILTQGALGNYREMGKSRNPWQ